MIEVYSKNKKFAEIKTQSTEKLENGTLLKVFKIIFLDERQNEEFLRVKLEPM